MLKAYTQKGASKTAPFVYFYLLLVNFYFLYIAFFYIDVYNIYVYLCVIGDIMKLISWNVNGLRAAYNKGFCDIFNDSNADIFSLQETKMQPEQLDINFDGYYKYMNSAKRKGYSGTAVFTKIKPIDVFYGIAGAGGRMVIRPVIVIPVRKAAGL